MQGFCKIYFYFFYCFNLKLLIFVKIINVKEDSKKTPKKSKRGRTILDLFLTFLKIGLFTFGGGYAMIPLIEEEIVNKHKWLNEKEMGDIFVIAESTPGPISVNSATYVGYRVGGFLGAFFATLGLVLPSFLIILLISYFFKDLLEYKIINAAFIGIKIAVSLLILDAAYRLSKLVKFDIYAIIVFIVIFVTQLLLTIFNIRFSSVYFLLFGFTMGLVLYQLVPYLKRRKK